MQKYSIVVIMPTIAFMLPSTALCTTVVAISTSDSIVLAADSMISRDESRNIGRACKIIVIESVAAAIAGHLGDTATAFDAKTYIRLALSKTGTLVSKADSFEQLVRPPLQRSLDYGRQHAPSVFASKPMTPIFGNNSCARWLCGDLA